MKECVDSLRKEPRISTLDGTHVYRQIEVDGRNRNKTAFTSHDSMYRLTSMPFRLWHDSKTFQIALQVIWAIARWQIAQVYLDNIAVLTKSLWTMQDKFEA